MPSKKLSRKLDARDLKPEDIVTLRSDAATMPEDEDAHTYWRSHNFNSPKGVKAEVVSISTQAPLHNPIVVVELRVKRFPGLWTAPISSLVSREPR